MPKTVYCVELRIRNDKMLRLVLANSPISARNFVCRDVLHISVPTQSQIRKLAKQGVPIEKT